jgi:hypothetical protein
MGMIEQSTGRAMNGLILLAAALLVAALVSVRLRHGAEERARTVASPAHKTV